MSLRVVLSEDEVYEFDQAKLMASEASMLQKYTGRTIKEWQEGMEAGDVDCMIGMVWLAMKRSGKVVTYDEVDFDLASIDVIDLDAEKKKAEDEAAKAADEAVDPLDSSETTEPLLNADDSASAA